MLRGGSVKGWSEIWNCHKYLRVTERPILAPNPIHSQASVSISSSLADRLWIGLWEFVVWKATEPNGERRENYQHRHTRSEKSSVQEQTWAFSHDSELFRSIGGWKKRGNGGRNGTHCGGSRFRSRERKIWRFSLFLHCTFTVLLSFHFFGCGKVLSIVKCRLRKKIALAL